MASKLVAKCRLHCVTAKFFNDCLYYYNSKFEFQEERIKVHIKGVDDMYVTLRS